MELKELDYSNKNFEINKIWNLPSSIKRAEAFVVISKNSFIVAEDYKNEKLNNIHYLKEHNSNLDLKISYKK